MQQPRENEGDHHHGEHRKRLLEQSPVQDCLGRDHGHDAGLALRDRFQFPSPHKVGHDGLRNHHHDDDRRQMHDEGVEVEADLRADQDVGRVADQRGRAANVRCQDLSE
jgi:hypothetical protein